MRKSYSWILALSFFLVAMNIVNATTYINESMVSNNASVWQSSSGSFNANYDTNYYGFKCDPTAFLTCLISFDTLLPLTFGKAESMSFTFYYNDTGTDPYNTYKFGIGANSGGYPTKYFYLDTNAGNDDLYFVDNEIYMLVSSSLTNGIYNITMNTVGTSLEIYLNNVLVYNNLTSVTLYGVNNQFGIYAYRPGSASGRGNFFISNITFTEIDAGYYANFTIRDEISYAMIDGITIFAYLYDASNTIINASTTSVGYFTLTNLSSATYHFIYHDNIYNPRTFYFTPNTFANNYTLFIINDTAGDPITFRVIDSSNNRFISNARIKLYKNINFTQQIIYDEYTDDSGGIGVYIKTSDLYTINAYKQGYANNTIVIQNLFDSTYNIYLTPTGSGSITEPSQHFYYRIIPSNNYLLYPSSGIQPINFYVAGEGNNIEYISINGSANGTAYSNISILPIGDTINISVWLSNFTSIYNANKSFEMHFYVKTLDYAFPWNTTIWYYVSDSANLTNRTIITGLAQIKNEFTVGERIILSIVVVIIFVWLFSYVLPGMYAMMVGLLILGVFSIPDFFPMKLYIFIASFGLIVWLSSGDRNG